MAAFFVFRLMFWTDWGSSPKIERANLTGLERRVLVSDLVDSGQYWPNALFIDFTEDRIYWIDAWIDTIDSCDLNGNNRRQVASPVHPTFDMHPFDFTVYDDILYWSDWNTDSIERLNWTTAAYIGSLGILTSDRVFGVALLDHSRQPASAGKEAKIQKNKLVHGFPSYTRSIEQSSFNDNTYTKIIQANLFSIITAMTEGDVGGKTNAFRP